MSTTEVDRVTPELTRCVHVVAALAGVGASFGIGLCALKLGSDLPEYVATNHHSLSARMALLRWLFVPMLGLPAIVALIATLRVQDPHRLRTLERVTRWFAPLTPLGLWPLLLQEGLWKGKTLLFLTATLTCTLVVWGATRRLSIGNMGAPLVQTVDALVSRLPSVLRRAAPWCILASFVAIAVFHGMRSGVLQDVQGVRPPAATTLRVAFRQLGHGGFLALPFASSSVLVAATKLRAFVFLVAVAGAVFPLYLFCRSRLGSTTALVVALAYLSFPALLPLGIGAPLPLGAAAVFFFLAAYAWERRKAATFVAAVMLMLCVHEQTAFWLVCLGVYSAYRQRSRWVVPILVLLPLAYFAVIGFVVLPKFGSDPYGAGFRSLWSDSTPGMLVALKTALINPAYALSRFGEQTDPVFWLLMLVPMALLPLRSRSWVLWLLPFCWFGVVAIGRFPGASLNHASIAHLIVMGFMATVATFEELRQNVEGQQRLGGALVTWFFALVPCVYQFGCLWLDPP